MVITARVIAPVALYGVAAAPGDVVEVDPITFANLSRKGRLVEVKEEEEKPFANATAAAPKLRKR